MAKGTRFSGEFKENVIKDIRENKIGYNEAMRRYGIAGRSKIQQWERISLEEGPEGLYLERRGRAGSANGARKGRPPKLVKKVEEDLIAENQRLRAENDSLKKLNAFPGFVQSRYCQLYHHQASVFQAGNGYDRAGISARYRTALASSSTQIRAGNTK